MKYIAEDEVTKKHLQRWSGPLPVLVISYYAWIAGHSLQKSWDGLKRTLLYQALKSLCTRPDIISLISPRRCTFAETLPYSGRFPTWETWEIEESLDRLLTICGKTVNLVLFIDGLDEFSLSPAEVVKLVTSISSSIKICVASRPWTEFDDAFSSAPLLQMHLLTQDDTKLYVAGKLDENQGFKEIRNIYPKQADEIKEDIVARSRGVFLWVSVVVQSLLISLSEGESISDLRATLDSLPSDVSSLYDVIWSRIRERNRRDGSWMIQVVAAAQGPLSCLAMWLADESRTVRVDVKTLPVNVKVDAAIALKRRLSSRTRGLLEMTGGVEKFVDFSHRTARDWAQQSEVWNEICSSYGAELDPYIILFDAETLALSMANDATDYSPGSLWVAITKTVWYASQSCDSNTDNKRLVELMDAFDKSIQETYETAQKMWPSPDRIVPGKHWSSRQNRSVLDNTFLSIAAQFSILPYIQIKAGKGRNLPHLKASEHCFNLLDLAVLGHEYFNGYDIQQSFVLPPISVERRLSTVQALLEAGSKPSKSCWGVLEDEKGKCKSAEPALVNYYNEVTAIIKGKKRVRARNVLHRISGIFSSL
ncbi:hypothetical protein PG991_016152 [Apiospora marii]|uniref:DUF7791 domain-containing protein n=1 Tax=Apiospora marii TaxID=335849 RepID=A0ABR1R0P5_9PEZI